MSEYCEQQIHIIDAVFRILTNTPIKSVSL